MADKDTTGDISVARAARNLKERKYETDKAIDKADSPNKKKPSKRPTPSGTTADQARKSKHKGPSGEPAYGAPIDRVKNQSTDSNN